MKTYVEMFENFLNEGKTFSTKDVEKLTGYKATEEEYEVDPYDVYKTVQSWMLDVPGVSEDYPLLFNIYDGKEFAYFQDAAPLSLSIHTPDQVRSQSQTLSEYPLSLSKLTPAIAKEAADMAKEYPR